MKSKQVLWFRERVDLEVMEMKEYFTLFKTAELGSHHQMQLSVISKTILFGKGLILFRGIQTTYSKPHWLSGKRALPISLNKIDGVCNDVKWSRCILSQFPFVYFFFRKWGRRVFHRNFWPLNTFSFPLFLVHLLFLPLILRNWTPGFIAQVPAYGGQDPSQLHQKMKSIRAQSVLHLVSIEEEDLTFHHLFADPFIPP